MRQSAIFLSVMEINDHSLVRKECGCLGNNNKVLTKSLIAISCIRDVGKVKLSLP